MGAITKRNRGFWPKMAQDFFGAENPFQWDDKFWFMDKTVEVPSANVIENDKEFKIELSAPGFDKKDFKIDVEDGVLNICAEKEHHEEEQKDQYRKKEFSYTSIRRSFVLPENVSEDSIDANYKNGLLRLVLPKSKMVKGEHKKAIEVG